MATLQEEIECHLRAMNAAWRLYDALENNPYASPECIDPVADQFERECQWLAAHGVAWMSLCYNPISKQHSLPPGGEQ